MARKNRKSGRQAEHWPVGQLGGKARTTQTNLVHKDRYALHPMCATALAAALTSVTPATKDLKNVCAECQRKARNYDPKRGSDFIQRDSEAGQGVADDANRTAAA